MGDIRKTCGEECGNPTAYSVSIGNGFSTTFCEQHKAEYERDLARYLQPAGEPSDNVMHEHLVHYAEYPEMAWKVTSTYVLKHSHQGGGEPHEP